MFSKTNLISTLLVAIWAYFGGYLLWAILGAPFLAEHLGSATGVTREPVDMIHLILGCIVTAFAFSTMYGKWANEKFSAGNGVVFGVWLAIFIGLGLGLVDFATTNVLDIVGTLASAGIYVVFLGVFGLLAGLVYSKMS